MVIVGEHGKQITVTVGVWTDKVGVWTNSGCMENSVTVGMWTTHTVGVWAVTVGMLEGARWSQVDMVQSVGFCSHFCSHQEAQKGTWLAQSPPSFEMSFPMGPGAESGAA